MLLYDVFDGATSIVRPRKRALIEKHLFNEFRKFVAIPDSKMIELVASQKQAFQMQEGEAMVYRCDKLGHPVIVRVFCLKSEFHKVMTRRGENRNSSEFQPAICRNPANLSIARRYKTKRNISSTGCIGNSAISQCDQIVIEIRRSRRQLGLLDRKSGPVEPRHLLECNEGNSVSLGLVGINSGARLRMPEKLWLKQSIVQRAWTECDVAPKNLAAIIAGDSGRRNFPRNSI